MFVPSRVSKEDYTYKSHKSDILIMQYVIVSDIKCFNKVLIYRKRKRKSFFFLYFPGHLVLVMLHYKLKKNLKKLIFLLFAGNLIVKF